MWTLKQFPFSSSSWFTIPITSQRAVDSAMYSASLVLSVLKYYILLDHIIGQPSYIIMYTVREWLDSGFFDDQCCHDQSRSMSKYHYNPLVLSSLKVIPCALVFNKYLHMSFTAY